MALNQDQPIGNNRFCQEIEAMTGQRRQLRQRGRPRNPEAEEAAIDKRAAVWGRIAAHYEREGDREVAGAVRGHLAEHYDVRPAIPTERGRAAEDRRER